MPRLIRLAMLAAMGPAFVLGEQVEPKDGLLVWIWSKAFPYDRLANPEDGHCGFFNGAYYDDQLWMIQEDMPSNPGKYLLINLRHRDRLVSGPTDGSVLECYDGDATYQDQLWYFPWWEAHWYQVKSHFYNTCKMEMRSADEQFTSCDANLEPYGKDMFRFETPFTTESQWGWVDGWDNRGTDNEIPKTWKYYQSLTESMAESTAFYIEAEASVSASVEGSLGPVGVGSDLAASVMTSFESTYARALEYTWSVTETTDVTIHPRQFLCMFQLQSFVTDKSKNNKKFTFSSSLTKTAENDECDRGAVFSSQRTLDRKEQIKIWCSHDADHCRACKGRTVVQGTETVCKLRLKKMSKCKNFKDHPELCGRINGCRVKGQRCKGKAVLGGN